MLPLDAWCSWLLAHWASLLKEATCPDTKMKDGNCFLYPLPLSVSLPWKTRVFGLCKDSGEVAASSSKDVYVGKRTWGKGKRRKKTFIQIVKDQ